MPREARVNEAMLSGELAELTIHYFATLPSPGPGSLARGEDCDSGTVMPLAWAGVGD